MGEKIDLTHWTNYRGDMGNIGTAYYTVWEKLEIIYHVSPLLNAEGHRRLVGNDIAVIIFREEGPEKFDVTNIDKLGTVPQVFALIQPSGDKFRLSFFSTRNIKPYAPAPPSFLVDREQAKNLLLTKMHNGLIMSNYCPPMNRLWYVPRSETLAAIIERYPAESKKERKVRQKHEKKVFQGDLKMHSETRKIEDMEETRVLFENDATDYNDINSLVLLICSQLAYEESNKIPEKVHKHIGFDTNRVEVFSMEKDEVQGFVAADESKIFIAFRGPKVNLKLLGDGKQSLSIPGFEKNWKGNVRKPFAKAITAVYKQFFEKLKLLYTNRQKIWFTGHSTGGAITTLAVHLLRLQDDPLEPFYNIAGTYTYGCPKIGDNIWSSSYNLLLKPNTFRVVKYNDVVPTIAAKLSKKAKYHHVGQQLFLNSDGKIERDFKPKVSQTSLSAHVIPEYFAALLPHHMSSIDEKYAESKERVYSTIRRAQSEWADDIPGNEHGHSHHNKLSSLFGEDIKEEYEEDFEQSTNLAKTEVTSEITSEISEEIGTPIKAKSVASHVKSPPISSRPTRQRGIKRSPLPLLDSYDSEYSGSQRDSREDIFPESDKTKVVTPKLLQLRRRSSSLSSPRKTIQSLSSSQGVKRSDHYSTETSPKKPPSEPGSPRSGQNSPNTKSSSINRIPRIATVHSSRHNENSKDRGDKCEPLPASETHTNDVKTSVELDLKTNAVKFEIIEILERSDSDQEDVGVKSKNSHVPIRAPSRRATPRISTEKKTTSQPISPRNSVVVSKDDTTTNSITDNHPPSTNNPTKPSLSSSGRIETTTEKEKNQWTPPQDGNLKTVHSQLRVIIVELVSGMNHLKRTYTSTVDSIKSLKQCTMAINNLRYLSIYLTDLTDVQCQQLGMALRELIRLVVFILKTCRSIADNSNTENTEPQFAEVAIKVKRFP